MPLDISILPNTCTKKKKSEKTQNGGSLIGSRDRRFLSFPHSGKPFPLSLRRDIGSLLCEAKVTLLRRALVLAA